MASDFSSTGAFNVNGQWSTAVRYEATTEHGVVKSVQLRFMNGRSVVATAQVSADEARELLGEKNYGAVAKAVIEAEGPGHDTVGARVKGELRGKALEFRQVILSGYLASQTENAISLDSRVRRTSVEDAVQVDAEIMRTPGPREAVEPALKTPDEATGNLTADRKQTRQDSDPEELAMLRRTRSAAVPDTVAERFLKLDDKYFFPDKTLAFIDRGTKLKAETHNLEVVRSLVAIAEARDWEALSITGSKEFRRQVWREASLRDIDVRGYEPSELERQELQRALEKRYGPNEIHRQARERAADAAGRERAERPGVESGSSPRNTPSVASDRSSTAVSKAKGEDAHSALVTGVLIEHGPARYKFDEKENASYYVKVKTDRGEKAVWGVDLERALLESRTGVKAGDVVSIENQGSKRVTVKVPQRDKHGTVIGEEEISTHRNAWAVEKPGHFAERTERALAFRNGERAKEELVVQYPELTNAIVGMHLGEQFAKKLTDRPEDRERVVQAIREAIASAIERGDQVNVPPLKDAADRKLDRISGEIDEVAQRTATEKAHRAAGEKAKGARGVAPPRVSTPVREEPGHARA